MKNTGVHIHNGLCMCAYWWQTIFHLTKLNRSPWASDHACDSGWWLVTLTCVTSHVTCVTCDLCDVTCVTCYLCDLWLLIDELWKLISLDFCDMAFDCLCFDLWFVWTVTCDLWLLWFLDLLPLLYVSCCFLSSVTCDSGWWHVIVSS